MYQWYTKPHYAHEVVRVTGIAVEKSWHSEVFIFKNVRPILEALELAAQRQARKEHRLPRQNPPDPHGVSQQVLVDRRPGLPQEQEEHRQC